MASAPPINPEVTRTEDRLVAFLDILGFSDSVREGGVAPEVMIRKLETFAVGVALKFKGSSLRVAAISDSALITTLTTEAGIFVEALLEVVQQCFASGVMLRGGVSQGPVSESAFEYALPNYRGMQVWGVPVVEAVRLEKRLKGARIGLGDTAAAVVRGIDPKLVVAPAGGAPPELRWVNPKHDDEYLDKLQEDTLKAYDAGPEECVHYVETMRFILRSTGSVKSLKFGLIAFVDAPHPPPGTADLWVTAMDRALALKQPDLLEAINNERTALARLISPASQELQAVLRSADPKTRRTFNAIGLDAWQKYMKGVLTK